jgi:GH15 family glucan-1,4-alpha-glucosidase
VNASIDNAPATPELVQASVDVMTRFQAATGAFMASPNFSVYQYSWLRDGSFIAHALDAAGHRDRSAAFHLWVAEVVERMAPEIEAVLSVRRAGGIPEQSMLLPTRYTAEGFPEAAADDDDAWPTVQFDGYGTWLWALQAHLGGGPVSARFLPAVRLVAEYLSACWDLPCYDVWEEYGDRLHTSTLAALAAGLRAAGALTGDGRYTLEANRIVTFLREACVVDGRFVKGPEDERVDASLLSLAVPFGVVGISDPTFVRTVQMIEAELTSPSGGTWRYLGDTYYGGGAWVLLTCWLGWYHALRHDAAAAAKFERWAARHADATLELPEQVIDQAQDARMVGPWIDKWGVPAHPLLWSHAMYVLLADALPGPG